MESIFKTSNINKTNPFISSLVSQWSNPQAQRLFVEIYKLYGCPSNLINKSNGLAFWSDNPFPYSEITIENDVTASDQNRLGILGFFIQVNVPLNLIPNLIRATDGLAYKSITNELVAFSNSIESTNALLVIGILIAKKKITVKEAQKVLPKLTKAAENNTKLNDKLMAFITKYVIPQSVMNCHCSDCSN